MELLRPAGRPSFLALLLLAATIGGGCRSDRPSAVPPDALHEAGGRPGEDRQMQFTTDRSGTVYVADAWDNSLVYSGPVRSGDRVTVDRDGGRITLNDRVVYEKPMRHTDHWIFFKAGPDGAP